MSISGEGFFSNDKCSIKTIPDDTYDYITVRAQAQKSEKKVQFWGNSPTTFSPSKARINIVLIFFEHFHEEIAGTLTQMRSITNTNV